MWRVVPVLTGLCLIHMGCQPRRAAPPPKAHSPNLRADWMVPALDVDCADTHASGKDVSFVVSATSHHPQKNIGIDPQWDEVRVVVSRDGRTVAERIVPVGERIALRQGERHLLRTVTCDGLAPGEYQVAVGIWVIKGESKGSHKVSIPKVFRVTSRTGENLEPARATDAATDYAAATRDGEDEASAGDGLSRPRR